MVSMKKKSYNQLNFLNLVTMATAKMIYKPFFMLIYKVVKKILVLGNLF